MAIALPSPSLSGAPPDRSPFLDVAGVSHGYSLGGRPVPVLDDVSLTLDRDGFAAIVGPSGSGKSTLLGLIAGLEEPDAGAITLGGSTRRLGRVGYMPQRDLLQPWRSALDNTTVALEVRGMRRAASRRCSRRSGWRDSRRRGRTRSPAACASASPSPAPCWRAAS
jgi:ABC-type nitrate/sulfonate/bicarbonate transport system ATPase subunit